MQKCFKSILLLLALLMMAQLCGCTTPEAPPGEGHTFTDSTGETVALRSSPQRVAALFSSHAEIWMLAGGTLTVTVGETLERGIVSGEGVTLVDSGAGKQIDVEALIAAAPELVIGSADVPAQIEAAAMLRQAGIPVALFRVETFADYLSMLKTCTDITGRADLYATNGTALQTAIDALIAEKPFAGKRILFTRATASTVKAKASADHFVAAMLTELGAVNIADEAPLLLDGLSMEAVLQEDPDYIFFTVMGNESTVRDFVAKTLQEPEWQALDAVQSGRYAILSKDLFHYKPNARWQAAYEALAALSLYDDG